MIKRAEASDALQQMCYGAAMGDKEPDDVPALRRLYIDFAYSISIGVHNDKCCLFMTLDGIDFTFCSAIVDRTEPENLIHEFMTISRLKIDCIRFDGAAEFAKSATFKAFCDNHHIAMEDIHARGRWRQGRTHASW